MHTQSQQEQADKMDGAAKLSDQLIAEIVARLKKHLHDDLLQLQFDLRAGDQRGRSLHFDP